EDGEAEIIGGALELHETLDRSDDLGIDGELLCRLGDYGTFLVRVTVDRADRDRRVQEGLGLAAAALDTLERLLEGGRADVEGHDLLRVFLGETELTHPALHVLLLLAGEAVDPNEQLDELSVTEHLSLREIETSTGFEDSLIDTQGSLLYYQ